MEVKMIDCVWVALRVMLSFPGVVSMFVFIVLFVMDFILIRKELRMFVIIKIIAYSFLISFGLMMVDVGFCARNVVCVGWGVAIVLSPYFASLLRSAMQN